MPDKPQKLLAEQSQFVAQRGPVWVQGAGGNLSFKCGGDLWIKATGFRLREITVNSGLTRLAQPELARSLDSVRDEAAYAMALGAAADAGDQVLKPSMETGFHACLPKPWVMHFHSLEALLMSHEHSHNSAKFLPFIGAAAGKLNLKFDWLPQLSPGLGITRALSGRLTSDVYVLQNHGVILQSESPKILDHWESVCAEFCESFGYRQINELRSGPRLELHAPFTLKVYFPDTAVFYEQICGRLALDSQRVAHQLPATFAATDPDLYEICLATQWLFEACPNLGELPAALVDSIARLPTEAARLAQQRVTKKGAQ